MIKKMICKIMNTHPQTLETIMGAQSVLWSMWLLLPYRTFESSTVYTVMASVANEEVWGSYFLLLGAIQLFAMHRLSRKIRTMVSFVMMFSWIFMDWGFWASGSSSAAAITYMMFVLIAIWSFVVLFVPDRMNGCE